MPSNRALEAMQSAVDIVNNSPHPTNKVAACVFDDTNIICETNQWPTPIEKHLGHEARIGNSSGTIHAETAALLSADFPTKNASICITDPFCPNCAKNIAEAGIAVIYIDHKGFEKDFWQRRSGTFDNMSMQIVEKAGIAVYRIHRKEERLEPIHEPVKDYIPQEDSPIEIEPASNDASFFDMLITHKATHHYNRKIAIGLAQDKSGKTYSLTARVHVVVGYSMQNDFDIDQITQARGKYSFMQEPVNRFLMACRRMGLTPIKDYLFCSQIPTSREQVNMIGAGFTEITIGDVFRSRSPDGFVARSLVEEKGLLKFKQASREF